MATSIFDSTHPNIIETTFSFPKFAPACKNQSKKISLFILEIQSNLECCDKTGHTNFWPGPPKDILINF